MSLFTRQANRVFLNARGEAFAARAEQALLLLDDAAAAAADDGNGGEIHICINTNRRIVMETVEKFQRLYPGVSVKTRVFSDPTERDFDLIVAAEDPRLRGYHAEKLLGEQVAIAIHKDSPFALWDGRDLSQLSQAPFVTMGESSSLYQLTEQLCRAAGFRPRIAVQSDDPYYVRKCVELGLGVAPVPLFSWKGQFSADVVLKPLEGCRRDTFLYTAPGRYLPLCVQRFGRMLAESCRSAE